MAALQSDRYTEVPLLPLHVEFLLVAGFELVAVVSKMSVLFLCSSSTAENRTIKFDFIVVSLRT